MLESVKPRPITRTRDFFFAYVIPKPMSDDIHFSCAKLRNPGVKVEDIYTGSLVASAKNQQLLPLATMYEVETLKNVCQYANRPPKDVEDLTNSLLELV
jgi:hypothetical protein